LDKSYAELEGRFSRVTDSFATFISILIKIEINVQLPCLRPMASVHSELEKSSYLFFFNIFLLKLHIIIKIFFTKKKMAFS